MALGPFGPAPRMAVGVSGGPHSLALALLAARFCAARGGDVLALVVDHGLRAGSAGEAAWTARTLAGRGIASEILELFLPRGAAVQERARSGRLAAMLARCAALGRPWLLLGQHRMDQAETVLFRALRGSGEAGLAGMAPLRAAEAAMILRPLLDVPPVALEALLRAEGLAPLRDPSNADPRFTRAALRMSLADPEGTGPRVAALAGAAAAFATRRARRQAAVAGRLAAALAPAPEGWAKLDGAALGQDAVAQAALSAVLRLLSGEEHAPAGAAVRALLARGGGTLHGVLWSGGVLCREPAACAPPVPAEPGALWDGRWRLRGSLPEAGLLLGALGSAGAAALPRAARRGLPARVLAGLPALWRGGVAVSVPPLAHGLPAQADFVPSGGPLCAYK
ncbi:tRNA lysidine(34) synthetase TilS [Teichococcus rhizosphaerae]|nr:tRNA lysidine(34) synthetase TilS [Pseudoroseomonas rhizosphaerae]